MLRINTSQEFINIASVDSFRVNLTNGIIYDEETGRNYHFPPNIHFCYNSLYNWILVQRHQTLKIMKERIFIN